MTQSESCGSTVGDSVIPFTTCGRSMADTDIDRDPGSAPTKRPVKLCEECGERDSKYTCPQCSLRTCSLECCRRHKEEKECSGVRNDWQRIEALEDYSHAQSVEDQSFMAVVKRRMEVNRPEKATADAGHESSSVEEADPQLAETSNLQAMLSNVESTALVEAAERRRIELILPVEGPLSTNLSRYDYHAETIFWTVRIYFIGPVIDEKPEMTRHEYTVKNIPESLSLRHLLKQFLEPRVGGYVISVEEVDEERIAPFREAGLDQLVVYLPAPGEVDGRQCYYPPLEINKTLLENLRRKRITNAHLTLTVAIRDAFPPDFFPINNAHSAYVNKSTKRPTEPTQSQAHQQGPSLNKRPRRETGELPPMRGRPFPSHQGPFRGRAEGNRSPWKSSGGLGGIHEWRNQHHRPAHPGNRLYPNQAGVPDRNFGRPWPSNGSHRPSWPAPQRWGGSTQTRYPRFQNQPPPPFRQSGASSRPRFSSNHSNYQHRRGGSPGKIAPRQLDPYERFIDRDPASIDPAEYVQPSSQSNRSKAEAGESQRGGEPSSNAQSRGVEKVEQLAERSGAAASTPATAQKAQEGKEKRKKNYLELLGEEYDSP